MRYRPFGPAGFLVSEIGFGTWGLGGTSYGPVDPELAKQALRLAFEKGVNFYDTSDLYGDGRSEELLAETFGNVRDKVLIATKGGTLPHAGFVMPQDFSPAHLRLALEGSLKRLRSDYIDLYQLHSPTLSELAKPEVLETLQAFQAEGKIRAFGVSVRSPADGLAAVESYGYPYIQVNFNMIDQRCAENNLFETAARRGAGIIARTPLCFGYLSGAMTGGEQFEGIDHRANWPKEQLERWANAPRLFEAINAGTCRTYAQLALRYCLAFQAVSTVIPGMLRLEEVEENVAASDMTPLTEAELAAVQNVYRQNEFYDAAAKSKGKP